MKQAQFVTIVLLSLALVPGGAHLLELPHKIGLDRDAYMTVQQIYQGWDLMGIVLVAALISCLVLAVLSLRQKVPYALALAAFVLLGSSLAIFFIWTFPMNKATENWTIAPANWAVLRMQWEYSHAVNAVLTFLALCGATASSLLWRAGAEPA